MLACQLNDILLKYSFENLMCVGGFGNFYDDDHSIVYLLKFVNFCRACRKIEKNCIRMLILSFTLFFILT